MNEDQYLIKFIKNPSLKPYKYPLENQNKRGNKRRKREGKIDKRTPCVKVSNPFFITKCR